MKHAGIEAPEKTNQGLFVFNQAHIHRERRGGKGLNVQNVIWGKKETSGVGSETEAN